MSLIAVTSSLGLSVTTSTVLRAASSDSTSLVTTALTPPSRIPSSCIAWSPDASTIYVASGGSVSAYDSSGAFIRDVVREGEGGIGGAKLGSMVVLQTQSGTDPVLAFSRGARAVIFDSETRRALQTVEGHRSSISVISLSQDQSLLATSSGEITVITNLVQQTNTVLRGAPSGVVAVAFHPTKRSTLLVLSPRGLHIFDITKGSAPIRTIPIGKAEAGAGYVSFSPIAPALVAVLVPGGSGRVLMLDIEKESSLVKRFTVEESVAAMSFSHDGGAVIVGTENGRILQFNLRGLDKPQSIIVDPAGGKIGGLSLTTASTSQLAKVTTASTARTSLSTSTTSGTRPTRSGSVTSVSTADSIRVKSSVDPRTPAAKLRAKPSINLVAKSPTVSTKSPDMVRRRTSAGDLLGKGKTSPGATTLRVKLGTENKPRPTSMITSTSARERTGARVRPVSMIEEKHADVGKNLDSDGAPGSIGAVLNAKIEVETSPVDNEPTVTPLPRRQNQTMPRRLTTDSSVRPTLTQIFSQDDLGTPASHARARSTSYSNPLVSPPDSAGPSATPISARSAPVSTTPSYTPAPAGTTETTTPSYSPDTRVSAARPVLDRPLSRLSEGRERTRSRLASEVIQEEEQTIVEERPRPRIVTEGLENDRERPASRLFKDETERPSSRAHGVLGLGRPSGTLARRFSTPELSVTPETKRFISDAIGSSEGTERERPASVLRERPQNLRERPLSELRERPASAMKERPESIFRDRSRCGTPLSASTAGRTPGKRVGWIDEESPYIEGVHDAFQTPARTPPTATLALASDSGSESGGNKESDSAARNRALLVTPRRGLAAALGAEVYAGDGDVPASKANNGKSSSITQTQAQNMLRNIVSDVMFEFRQETKEDVRGLHLDLIRASRGWKNDLKQYLGETLDELREVKEENARLRAEIARLKRGY